MADLYPESQPAKQVEQTSAQYDYVDESGELLFQVVRREPKSFRQRRPDGNGGWTWSLNGTRRVLYRLPAVIDSAKQGQPIFVVEGEKDVHALERLGITATCNPGGAGKWRQDYNATLEGARVVVCGDRDRPGDDHARAIAEGLLGVASEVRLLELDASGEKGYDLADFLADARNPAELMTAKRVLREAVRATPNLREADRAFVPSPPRGNGVVTKATALAFKALDAVLDSTPPEPEWLLSGYVAPGVITLAAGRPKVGKSTWMFGLMEALGAGRPFIGLSTRKSGICLLTEEREQTLADKRRLFDVGGVATLMRHEAAGASWPDVAAQAQASCHENGHRLLIVDTIDKWVGLAGDSENSAGAVLEALEPLQRAAGSGLAVLLVAHQRKSHGDHGEAVRGSNALTGGVDVVVELERAGGAFPSTARVLKSISRFSGTPETLVCNLTDAAGYEALGDLEQARADQGLEQVRAALADSDAALSAKDVEEATGLSNSSARRFLKHLHDKGETVREGKGGPQDQHRYLLSSPAHIPTGDETNPNVEAWERSVELSR